MSVLEQMEADDDEDETIYQTTKKKLEHYKIAINQIAEMSKSELKKLVKSRIGEDMEKIIGEAAEKMTKLRFIKDYRCRRKEYMEKMGGFESIHTLKTTLNMLPVYMPTTKVICRWKALA